jgi:hypothetical protein
MRTVLRHRSSKHGLHPRPQQVTAHVLHNAVATSLRRTWRSRGKHSAAAAPFKACACMRSSVPSPAEAAARQAATCGVSVRRCGAPRGWE